MAIEAVVFDLGGVLEIVDDAVWPLAWTHRWAGELGMTVEEWTDRMAAYDLAGVSEAMTRSAYKAGLGLSDAEVAVMFDDLWDRYCGRLDTELMAYVDGLAPSYRLAILSNSGDGARREEEKRFGLSRLFDPIIYSHEVGVAKPDPRIYALACELTGIKPGEMVFVDDIPANVASAAGIGIHAIHHTSTPATIRAIEDLLRCSGLGGNRN